MSENFKRRRRHKSTSKENFIFPILCLALLGAAMWTNSIGKNYNFKINELETKINAASSEALEIESKNKDLEDSIAELDSQIEKIKTELN